MNTIAKNTVYLYGRQVVATILALITSRIVLYALGVVDMGVYGVVGGVVTMFAYSLLSFPLFLRAEYILQLKRDIHIFSIGQFIKVMMQSIGAALLSFALCFVIHTLTGNQLIGLAIVCCSSALFTASTFYLLVCDSQERTAVRKAIAAILPQKKNHQ